MRWASGAAWRLSLAFATMLATRPSRAEEPATVDVFGSTDRGAAPGRPTSVVREEDLRERSPRSAPDALRFEPGVFVQQTAHGQASAFIRGRTGQQTVLLFDGIRMNTSTFRQGPNQYFFTLDTQTIRAIEVTRGGASTTYGSDALGGVLDAKPIEPRLDGNAQGFSVRPRALLRYATADQDVSSRLQLDAQLGASSAILVGGGFRRAGLLEGGGVVRGLDGTAAQVPALDTDGRTQLGTGFRELTGDVRYVWQLSSKRRVTAAAYAYRQFDAPRTDLCPPPFAPRSECVRFDEQFRTLAYVAFDGDLGDALMRTRLALSYQRQHERRTRDRPSGRLQEFGRDDVDTFGLTAKSATRRVTFGPALHAQLAYGADVFTDRVDSAAWLSFTDLGLVIPQSRGQYLAGSTYTHGGAFSQGELAFGDVAALRAGFRGGGAYARSPADAASGTSEVDRGFPTVAGNIGVELKPERSLSWLVDVDRSYRAPNLDDLTSRQQTGPGFQFENTALRPERATTFETGVRVTRPRFEADLWVYRSVLHGAMTRVTKTAAECPESTPQCGSSWNRYQLVNIEGASTIDGVEASFRAQVTSALRVRASMAYATGDGPNPSARPSDPRLPYAERVPLSRVPPLNGSAELRWGEATGAYAGAALRWALAQDRLAISDQSDARIPGGGTPGFALCDLRLGYRWDVGGHRMTLATTLENLFDSAYRYHGSGINGPGRGAIVGFSVDSAP